MRDETSSDNFFSRYIKLCNLSRVEECIASLIGNKAELDIRFIKVSYLVYSSILKIEAKCSTETAYDLQRTHGVISHKTETFMRNGVCISLRPNAKEDSCRQPQPEQRSLHYWNSTEQIRPILSALHYTKCMFCVLVGVVTLSVAEFCGEQ
jgi:hypothetical protein